MQRQYLNDRLIEDRPGGYVVIVPSGVEPPVPLGCPVCLHVMRSYEDEVAYNEFECCNRCAMMWAHPRRQTWKDGWRPTADQVAEAETTRLPLALTLEVD